MREFALTSVGTEAEEVKRADHSSSMAILAIRTMSAETTVVPRAVLDLALGIDVTKRALLVAAGQVFREEEAFRHLAEIVLVQELALIALLAQSTEPMLAHNMLVLHDVSKRAMRSKCAALRLVLQADSLAALVHSGERDLSQPSLVDDHLLDFGELSRRF